MRALVVTPRQPRSARVTDVPDPRPSADEVLVRGVRIGLCGTDHEINEGLYGSAPEGSEVLVLGHESVGRVERGTADLPDGTYVVGIVRRPDGCPNCAAGEPDMCLWGRFTERGIGGLHGFGSEWWAERPEYVVAIPDALAGVGVLLEPLTVVEKVVRHAFLIQRRLRWEPKRALVAGAGPIGVLGAVLLRLRGIEVTVFERTEKAERRALLARIGAAYAATGATPLAEIVAGAGPIDLAVEATGSGAVGFALIEHLGTNGVLGLTSVSGGDATAEVPVARANRLLVLGNRAVFGSVNANRADFEQGVRDLGAAQGRWPGFLGALITSRVRLGNAAPAVTHDPRQIKVVVELGGP
ncbi:MAG: glucose 1-dehydrogenase [Chloroflexi bacterium]|nr:glucose 1-dehydrogenase [Chloroflexota bacterium]